MKQYNNDLTPEMLAAFDQSQFAAEQLEKMNEEARNLIATEGSLTRGGATVISEYNGQQIEIEDGRRLNVSIVGDKTRYPYGTTAKISTGIGNTSGDSAILVGSLLDNGDEIITSPQRSVRRAVRAGESLPENFLK
ncbi:hypothetical protein K5E19_15095 [Enterobacter sp. RIT637]|uniref:hypothetical protein n=1 Tax=Enterobacter sp. RIT637 TaxID=2870470 RepID=UPI001C86A8C1|nr:hypothetical protein [Enterobacter sp. RIT637]MBX8461773.1 hypothetical protein [Enterobacter sp. RIT637]